jgi:hypothetical protein
MTTRFPFASFAAALAPQQRDRYALWTMREQRENRPSVLPRKSEAA